MLVDRVQLQHEVSTSVKPVLWGHSVGRILDSFYNDGDWIFNDEYHNNDLPSVGQGSYLLRTNYNLTAGVRKEQVALKGKM